MLSLECKLLDIFFNSQCHQRWPERVALTLFPFSSCSSGLAQCLALLQAGSGEAVPCSVQGMGWILWKRLSLCGWLSWQVISSLQAQLAEAQSSQEAQLREELQRADQKVQQKALQVKEYEHEVSVGFVLKVLHPLSSGVG